MVGLFSDNVLECTECGHQKFRVEEQVLLHKKVTERVFDTEKEHPLPHMQKWIVYHCARCGQELDK